jgi:hypothetical protein
MLAYDHVSLLTDDMMLHSALLVQGIEFPFPALILNSTGVALTPDSMSGVPAYLYFGIGAAVVVIVIAGITLRRKTLRHRLVRVLASN